MMARFLLLMFSLLPLRAQVITGSILGSVTDPSGHAVPNATVVVRNVGTKARNSATTGDSGDFTISLLPRARTRWRCRLPASRPSGSSTWY